MLAKIRDHAAESHLRVGVGGAQCDGAGEHTEHHGARTPVTAYRCASQRADDGGKSDGTWSGAVT
jgi:hypothetical protein